MCGFWMQNSDFWTGITSLYGSQTKPVILCMQNSVISTWITSLYGFQPSSVVFAYKTATLGAELQVSICPRPHLSFCACKTAWLASEILVSMGPSPDVWILDSKQRLLDRNNKSLWVPDKTCCFCIQNSDFWSRITSLNLSQTSPVVLCMQNSVISIRITSLYGSQPWCVAFGCKTATFGPE